MPKMTAKYSTALAVARREKIQVNGNQEELYSQLQDIGWWWNSDRKEWQHHEIAEADEPTPLIMVRVWADAEIVEDVTDDFKGQRLAHHRGGNQTMTTQQVHAKVNLAPSGASEGMPSEPGRAQVIIRRIELDDQGQMIAKYGLTGSGEWVKVGEGEAYPIECYLSVLLTHSPTSFHPPGAVWPSIGPGPGTETTE